VWGTSQYARVRERRAWGTWRRKILSESVTKSCSVWLRTLNTSSKGAADASSRRIASARNPVSVEIAKAGEELWRWTSRRRGSATRRVASATRRYDCICAAEEGELEQSTSREMGQGSERVSKSAAQCMSKEEVTVAASEMKDQKALQFVAIRRQRRHTCATTINVGCRRCGAVGGGGALGELEWRVS
jgi:hypothetical protein